MRRFLSALTMSLCLGMTAHAQVYIFNENMLKERMSEIKTRTYERNQDHGSGFTDQ